MTNEDLVTLIREISKKVGSAGPKNIDEVVAPLRLHVQPNCHIGKGKEMDHTDAGFRMQLEWYAGQLLDMVQHRSWFGINRWINCTEKFTTRKEQP